MGEDGIFPLGNVQAYDVGQGGRDVLPSASAASAGAATERHSDTPCYTCRRRRVTCDKLLPSCRKCHLVGKQCLGYKRPLTWVKGVASRGKMMGLTFDDVAPKQRKGERTRLGTSGPSELGSSGETGMVVTPRSSRQSWSPSEFAADARNLDNRTLPVDISSLRADMSALDDQLVIRPALVDPVLEGLDRVERYYLSYYDQNFCRLMVLYEIPHENPYRRLLPLVKTSTTLASAIAAVGACHYMHTCNSDTSLDFAASPDSNVRSAYQHALMFKQRALRLLRDELLDPNKRRDPTIIASILMLLTLDIVESGQGDWKIHVAGARDFIRSRLGQATGNRDEVAPLELMGLVFDSFESFITDTLMTIDIMGSTLARSGTWSEPICSDLMRSPHIVSASETFLGCPAYLFRIILFITSVRHSNNPITTNRNFASIDMSPTRPADLQSILAQIDKFDAEGWAMEMNSRMSFISTNSTPPSPRNPYSHSLTPLYHLTMAYKLAITLYSTRVLLNSSSPSQSPPFSLSSRVSSLIFHLSVVPRTSEFFKCMLWPVFIAGAECRDPQQKEWIQSRLRQLWDVSLTVNIKAAGRALEVIWASAAEAEAGTGTESDGNWIQFLDRGNFSWLFI